MITLIIALFISLNNELHETQCTLIIMSTIIEILTGVVIFDTIGMYIKRKK